MNFLFITQNGDPLTFILSYLVESDLACVPIIIISIVMIPITGVPKSVRIGIIIKMSIISSIPSTSCQ